MVKRSRPTNLTEYLQYEPSISSARNITLNSRAFKIHIPTNSLTHQSFGKEL